ncbi:cytochrome c551/cytochrome c550 [Seinonella peptonophila]|uniref:Cytochrome c551/cytochrome c550 n=1 Tax=Seinonella peptonophila TaxID=112248 RepID=A0A1M4XQI0_9BACL|nr:cytochrome c [Seinonella peptonophila]SHE95837.1 cytochrome c551/cytochrome c550 [Seinonella peptonophila]
MIKKSIIHLLTVTALIIVIAGCQSQTNQQSQKTETTQEVSQAPDQIFSNNCSSCHGMTLEGGMGPNLQKIGSKLKKEQIADIIKNGKNSMPSQPQISDQARDKLADWLAQKK